MFGSSKINMLESQIRSLNERIDQAAREKDQAAGEMNQLLREKSDLEQQLLSSAEKVNDLENQLKDSEYEELKSEADRKQAEYEELKNLLSSKIQEQEGSMGDREEEFARSSEVSRFFMNYENEKERQTCQESVVNKVKDFSDSFNYYLNQIKVLMEALGDVASGAGAAMFLRDGDGLKSQIGQEMVDKLKTEADELRDGDGLLLIGTEE